MIAKIVYVIDAIALFDFLFISRSISGITVLFLVVLTVWATKKKREAGSQEATAAVAPEPEIVQKEPEIVQKEPEIVQKEPEIVQAEPKVIVREVYIREAPPAPEPKKSWLDSLPETEYTRRQKRIVENKRNGVACCPKCGSTSLSVNKKGYSFVKGVRISPLGGTIGMNKLKVTCLNCGHTFKPGR